MVTPSYATLINRKLLIPSPKAPYTAVEINFFQEVMSRVIANIRVDETWYLQTYPDIAAAVQEGKIPNARNHYCRHGYYEHRLPYQITIDDPWYRAQYQDVDHAVATGIFPNAQFHFDEIGFREGRLPWAGFAFDEVGG
jgi:hypothetical protein